MVSLDDSQEDWRVLCTRWFVMMALPSLDLIESGSLPGYELGVWRVRDVRGGDVKRTFSRGRRTKDWGPSSMTQFMDILRVLVQCSRKDLM